MTQKAQWTSSDKSEELEIAKNRIKELENRIILLLSSTQSWEAVAADKQARIEELEGERDALITAGKALANQRDSFNSKLQAVREYCEYRKGGRITQDRGKAIVFKITPHVDILNIIKEKA